MTDTTRAAIDALAQHPAIGFSPRDVIGGVQATQDLCFELALYAGWHDNIDYTDVREVATKLALIHSEVSEALEGVRKGKMDDHLPDRKAIEVELADALIRILDLGGAMGLDLAGAVICKLAYNATRKDHTREARAAEGGKKV